MKNSSKSGWIRGDTTEIHQPSPALIDARNGERRGSEMKTAKIQAGGGDENISVSEPASLCCPISCTMFRDPVIVIGTGYTYERGPILKHFKTNLSDPITGESVTGELQVNRAVRDAVEEWLKANAGITPRGWDDTTVPDPDNTLQIVPLKNFVDKLDDQKLKWKQLRRSLQALGCDRMHSVLLVTNKSTIVKEIHLSGLNLAEIPAEVFDFPYLEALYVDDNQIRTVSPKISQLKNLRIFNAARNKLKSIPKEILSLKSLEYLNLAHNELVEMPQEIHSFKELRELRIDNNNLTDMDLDMSKINVLCRLFVGGNDLSDKFSSDLVIVKG